MYNNLCIFPLILSDNGDAVMRIVYLPGLGSEWSRCDCYAREIGLISGLIRFKKFAER